MQEIMQENVCKCTKIREIREHFLSQMIPDIRYFIGLTTFLTLPFDI